MVDVPDLPRLLLGVVAFTGTLTAPALARAGCPNPCKLSAEPLATEPPLACGAIELHSVNDCDCGVFVDIDNPCETPLVAVDFEFSESCGSKYLSGGRCALAPQCDSAPVFLPLDSLGETWRTRTLRDAGGEHEVTVVAHVSEFEDAGCRCSLVGRARSHWAAGAALSGLVLAGPGAAGAGGATVAGALRTL